MEYSPGKPVSPREAQLGEYIALASHNRIVQIWRVSKHQKIFTFHHNSPVYDVAWWPSGHLIASSDESDLVQVQVAP